MQISSKPVKTTCPYCGVGCGVIANTDANGEVHIQGDKSHPANFGRLCSKGSALGETTAVPNRLIQPEIMGRYASWETALDTVANRLRDTLETHGPDAVAFYVSGQLLTEDYYIANKLMKGFIGSANIDTNSRLCMSSTVAGYKRAFGEDVVPCSYEDLELADMIVLTGSNTAWCHPILFQRIKAAKRANPDLYVVVIDPRQTATTEIADLHLALEPGADAQLFNGLLASLRRDNQHDHQFTDTHCDGVDDAIAAAMETAGDIATTAQVCGLSITDIEAFYARFAATEKVVTVFSQGINQSSSGVDKVNAIINCHLLSGRIGKPGMGPFSFTGQPNAMGGREVGGLANQLAAHMEIANPDHRATLSRFWQTDRLASQEGLKAVDMFDAVERGDIKFLWIMATNPAASMPEADRISRALKACDCVIVSDCVRDTDTVKHADIALPAITWGERDGTVTNSDRTISRQRPFLHAPGVARPDWWILREVAHRMGWEKQFNYDSSADIFREHAALSAFENDGARQFNLAGFVDMSDAEYTHLSPTQWPVRTQQPSGTPRLFCDGAFSTPNAKAKLIPIIPRAPRRQTSAEYPYVLNTGRIRDQWHTMTRTGHAPRLSAHIAEPFVEIHPEDALTHGLATDDVARVTSTAGEALVRVHVTPTQRRGSLFIPMHWSHSFSAKAKVTALVPSITDPISGQPESKHAPARIARLPVQWFGFVLTRQPPSHMLDEASYWTRSRGTGLWRYELAGLTPAQDWSDTMPSWLTHQGGQGQWAEYADAAKGTYRAALIRDNVLQACVFIAPTIDLPDRDWLSTLFGKTTLSDQERAMLLSGSPPGDHEDAGKTICSCFSVGEKTICRAIKEQNITSVEELGKVLKAGTNCGSCVAELKQFFPKAKAAQSQAACSSEA